MKTKTIFISLSLALVLLIPILSQAAIIDTDLITKAQDCKASGCSLNLFLQLGINVANFILGIVGALTLLMFVYGGLMWILSAGSSDRVQKGKDIIIGSVVGLLIVFCSYMIVKFVSKDLLGGEFNSTAPADTYVGDDLCAKNGGKCKNPCDLGDITLNDGNYCQKNGGGTCCKTKSDKCANDNLEQCVSTGSCLTNDGNGNTCVVSGKCDGELEVCCSKRSGCFH